MRRFLRGTTAALLAGAVVASCGDQTNQGTSPVSGGDDPGAVVSRYLAALAAGEGRTACGLLTHSGRQGLRQLPRGGHTASCERAVAQLARDSVRVRRPRVQDLRISGRTATARIKSDDPPYDSGVLLRMEGGWKIAYPPGIVSRFDTPPGIRPHEDDEHERRDRG